MDICGCPEGRLQPGGRPLTLSLLSQPLGPGGNVSAQQQSLKVTFQSDMFFFLFLQMHCFLFVTLKWMKAGDGRGGVFRENNSIYRQFFVIYFRYDSFF